MINYLKTKYLKLKAVDDYKAGFFEKAINRYESLWKITPFEHNPLHIHILCHYWLEEYDTAIELIEEGLEVFNNDEIFIALKESCFVELEDFENAVKTSALLIQIDENNETYLTAHALNLSKTGQNEESINVYKKITSPNFYPEKETRKAHFDILDHGFQASNNSFALNNLGYQRMKLGEHKEAIANFNRVIELDPEHAFAYNNRGFAYLKLGDLDQAIYNIECSLELDSNNSYAYKNRALYHLELENKKAALADLNLAWALGFEETYGNEVNILIQKLKTELIDQELGDENSESKASILNNLGYQKLKAKEFQEALECFNRAILIDDKYAAAYNNRGFAFLNLGELGNAKQDIDTAIELDEENALAFKNKALFFHKLNHFEEALINLKIAKALGFEEKYGAEVNDLIQQVEKILSNKESQDNKWYQPFWNAKT